MDECDAENRGAFASRIDATLVLKRPARAVAARLTPVGSAQVNARAGKRLVAEAVDGQIGPFPKRLSLSTLDKQVCGAKPSP